jgi:hypothetical protein
MKTNVLLKFCLLGLLIALCILLSYFAEPEHSANAGKWWLKLGSSALAEIAAALIGAVATILLIEESNTHRLRELIDRNLRNGLDTQDRYLKAIDDRITSELASYRILRDDLRFDMQSVVIYRLFGHWPDRFIIKRLNERIFAKSLIREKQDIVCTVLPTDPNDPMNNGKVHMLFAYTIQYRNLSERTETGNPFVLSLDQAVAINADGSGTLESLTVAPILPGETNPLPSTTIDLARVERRGPTGNPPFFTFSIAGQPELFQIEAGGGLEWCFTYVTRQKAEGSENFVLRDMTKRLKLQVNHGGIPANRFAFTALTDSHLGKLGGAKDWSSFEIADLLLPRQGISLSWDCRTAAVTTNPSV